MLISITHVREKWPPVHMTEGVLDLCSEAVSEKTPQMFWPSLPVEYVILISGQTDAPEVRCDLTDRQTDKQTHKPNYSNPRRACAPRVNNKEQYTYCNLPFNPTFFLATAGNCSCDNGSKALHMWQHSIGSSGSSYRNNILYIGTHRCVIMYWPF